MDDSFEQWLNNVNAGNILFDFFGHVVVIQTDSSKKEYIGELVDIDREFCTLENLLGERTCIKSKHIVAIQDR